MIITLFLTQYPHVSHLIISLYRGVEQFALQRKSLQTFLIPLIDYLNQQPQLTTLELHFGANDLTKQAESDYFEPLALDINSFVEDTHEGTLMDLYREVRSRVSNIVRIGRQVEDSDMYSLMKDIIHGRVGKKQFGIMLSRMFTDLGNMTSTKALKELENQQELSLHITPDTVFLFHHPAFAGLKALQVNYADFASLVQYRKSGSKISELLCGLLIQDLESKS